MSTDLFTSKDALPVTLAVVGFVALVLALKFSKMLFKLVFGLVALALLGVAIWRLLVHH